MLQLTEVVVFDKATSDAASLTLTLNFEDRRRSRLLTRLNDGQEVALMLPRGTVLRDGDRLRAGTPGVAATPGAAAAPGTSVTPGSVGSTGEWRPIVTVRAAPEALSVARTADPHLLTRAAYHLGNRHVPLQIGPDWLAYQHDHVLDDLSRELGLAVSIDQVPFEPEAGGYRHQGSHAHDHPHNHAADHAHDHKHGHDH